MTRTRLILTLAGLVALAAPAGAQGRGKGNDVPDAYRPPAGMCRIWLDNVPAAQQPAPTDCASAVRNRPSNGRVIFGDELKDKSKKFKAPPGRGGDDAWGRRRSDERRPDDRRDDDRRDDARRDDDREEVARGDDSDDERGALPAMAGGALFMRGVRTPDVVRWLRRDGVTARVTDADRDGMPERITWLDARSGQVVQDWYDRDGDGRADRVELYRDGRRTRVVGGN